MTARRRTTICIAALLGLPLGPLALLPAQAHPAQQEESAVTARARGTFDVQLTPRDPDVGVVDTVPARLTIAKQFHGDLEGTSRGQMLTAMTALEGSAGYVAIERVRGTLQGRTGTFVLQHSGTLDRGASRLTITVVPDSGTEELAGLAGQMAIVIEDGKHSYDFRYSLPGAR